MHKLLNNLSELADRLRGEIHTDNARRRLYATDASPYQSLPLAVAYPKDQDDCILLVQYAHQQGLPLIIRGAGTSLAGQCVGTGIVVDVSRHMRDIIAIDPEHRLATVQPGVTPAQLNAVAKHYGLMFAPDPSTSDRCTIGGMLGNNAWGAHAPCYGTTRESVIAIRALLSDGNLVDCRALSAAERLNKLRFDNREGQIYRILDILMTRHRDAILRAYPSCRGIPNNAGYALDVVARQQPWNPEGENCNLAPFLCGSEGTLVWTMAITVKLVPIPPVRLLVCPHFRSLDTALHAVVLCKSFAPVAIELLDQHILSLKCGNRKQRDNRRWVEGEPEALLLVEFAGDEPALLLQQAEQLTAALRTGGSSYAYPILSGDKLQRAWDLRRAGLGLLMGQPGRRKPVTGIEDTAVVATDLPAYADEILALVRRLGTDCVAYGSVSMGLIHFRPFLDLHTSVDREIYAALLEQVAGCVSRYGGSLSAKHGDGRLRAALLAKTLGEEIVGLLQQVKNVFDPEQLFNPGKILEPLPLLSDLRVPELLPTAAAERFEQAPARDWRTAAEQCHGAGVCLKPAGQGSMCPSYKATGDEWDTTRGRANLLRQRLAVADTVNDAEVYGVLERCLMCKACKSECPANVDMARLKAEFLQHYYDRQGIPWRARMLGWFVPLSAIASRLPWLINPLLRTSTSKKLLGIHPARVLPELASQRLSNWYHSHLPQGSGIHGEVAIVNDPITEYFTPHIGRAAIMLLERLGYRVRLTRVLSSSRVAISQGLLRQAQGTITATVATLYPFARQGMPLIGLEPSEIFTFRDEALTVLEGDTLAQAKTVAEQTLCLEEFLLAEQGNGRIDASRFHPYPTPILLHVHCHQRAFIDVQPSLSALQLLPAANIRPFSTGCCGMAGTFGYRPEHYELSQQIASTSFQLPAGVVPANALIVSNGFSCGLQIASHFQRKSLHLAELLQRQLIA